MYNDITTEERIDNYLLGRMSDEERRAFESDLEKNAELKEEYECQKEIANAIQRVAMREFLNQLAVEQNSKEKERLPHGVISFDRIREFFRSKQGVWSLVSVAAAVVIVVAGGLSYSGVSRTMSIRGDYVFAEVREYVPRGGDEIDSLLVSAYNLIRENEFKTALVTIEEAKKLVAEEKSAEGVTERENYPSRLLQMKDDELDWYEAIVLMKQGRVFKARNALKTIASSDSRYAESAAEELKKPFNRKRKAQ